MPIRNLWLLAIAATLSACSSVPKPEAPATVPAAPGSPSVAPPPGSSKYYLDDGPGDSAPANLDAIPDAVPRPSRCIASPTGRTPCSAATTCRRRRCGRTASAASRRWYGRKFHGQKTSIGETYDMYAMTAAHPTLPLPSYARVTNVATRRERGRPRQRPRAVPARPRHRPLVRRGAPDRHRAEGQRRGRGRGDPARRGVRWSRPRRCRRWPPAPLARRTAAGHGRRGRRADAGGRGRTAASSSSSARSRTTPTRRISSRTSRTKWRRPRSNRRCGRSTGCSACSSGRTPTRDEARRTADRLREALGLSSTIAVH